MIFCKHLNESFSTHKDMLKAIVERKDEIISLKKAVVKMTDASAFTSKTTVIKSESQGVLKHGDVVRNIINTTNYMDSHDDVHADGIWNKSAKEQNGKVYHVADHNIAMGSIVGYPKDVQIEVTPMAWEDLNVDAQGETQALIFETKMTDKTNLDVFKAYRDNDPVQHSVRMEYVGMKVAVNDPDAGEAYATFHDYLPKILNKERAIEKGYFFLVTEAKISREGSTVPFGSNDMTPSLGRKTPITEPQKSTLPTGEELKEVFSTFKITL